MSAPTASRAAMVIVRCRELARITDVPEETTRLFLSPATRDAHMLLEWWMRKAGLEVRIDAVGNVRGLRRCGEADARTVILFSHIDTVPNAGAFDGPLGVILALATVEELRNTPLPFDVEVIAFSEEEGVRFSFPFLSSMAVTGQLAEEHLARTDKDGVSFTEALRCFRGTDEGALNSAQIAATSALPPNTFAAVEVHIEQGPVLEANAALIAAVAAIAGQSRLQLTFKGQANHAGTTPMPLRQDALVAAAQWIVEVERYALNYTQLVATVGRISALPGAMNVVPGEVVVTLDVRHPKDESRHAAVAHLLTQAQAAGEARGVKVHAQILSEQKAVPMDEALTAALQQAAAHAGYEAASMISGAGHDAMILAPHVPTTMLFVRSPSGLSHHPDETVREEDVEAALATMLELLLHLHP